MHTQNFEQELIALLNLDLVDLEQLKNLLEAERSALAKRSQEEIEQLADSKQTLVQAIEARAKQKAKLIAQSGHKIRPGQVSESLKSLGYPQLAELWLASLSKLEECQNLNLRNGAIIQLSLQRTNKIMNIIRGQNQAPKLYGKAGSERAISSGQRIAQA